MYVPNPEFEYGLNNNDLKGNLAYVRMAQWMYWLTKYMHKQEMPCTQWYALRATIGYIIQQPFLHK